MKKIIIDACGGDDFAEIIKGAIDAAKAKEYESVRIVLCGDETSINGLIKSGGAEGLIDVVHTTEIITNDESPTLGIKNKKDSSLVRGFRMLKDDDDCIGIISAGSTGAVLTGASLLLGRMKNVFRPTLVTLLPTVVKDKVAAIADSGANVDSRPEYLLQYAIMAEACVRSLYKIDRPSVALVNVGTEDKKGNSLTHEAFELLKSSGLNFVGNMEARDACLGKYDVLVCDGFDGNILLKSTEGTAAVFFQMMKEEISKSFKAKMGYLLMKNALRAVKNRVDFNYHGGGVFLGVNKIVIKAHGSSKSRAIFNCVGQVIKLNDSNVLDAISSQISGIGKVAADNISG